MSWGRENPRYRRSSNLVRRKKKKGFFSRLDNWWRGRKELSKDQAEPDHKHQRPEPPIPPQLMEELKIAVPRPRAPKPRPAAKVCPPPAPRNLAGPEARTAPKPKKLAEVKSPILEPAQSPSGREADQAPAEPAAAAEPLIDPLLASEKNSDTFQASTSAALSESDEDFFANTRQGARKVPETVSGPDEPATELIRPEPPAADESLAEDGATVVPLTVELDRSEVKTTPASSYQEPPAESGPVRLVATADDSSPADPPRTVETDDQVAPSLEDESPAEKEKLFDSPAVSVEPAQADQPETPAGPAPLTATSREEGTVDYRHPKSSAKRREGRSESALARSAFLRWGLVAGLVGLLAAGIGLGWSYFTRPVTPTAKVARIPVANLPKVPPLKPGFFELYAQAKEAAVQTEATIVAGSGLGQALEQVGLGASQRAAAIIECLTKQGGINPSAVKAGVVLRAYWADRSRQELRRLEYHPETGAAPLVVMPRADSGYWLYNTASPLLTLNAAREGVVESSLWQAGSEAGLDPSVILTLSDILASDVDFFNDIKKGDSFQVLYSREYQDGLPQGTPTIDMVKLVNKGRAYEYYRFVGPNDKVAYYDLEGRTSHKDFFVTPLQYKRISSGYTMKRLHPIHRVVRPHQGVDYAAPLGTPVSSVADGTVIFADWNGGYGRLITIKHDETYTTMYAHLSRFAPGLKKGDKVKQGDLIGYVGATGTATGPHLDFRLKKNGNFIDPVPELAKQQGRKLESGDFIGLTKKIGEVRERMKEQLAANNSGV